MSHFGLGTRDDHPATHDDSGGARRHGRVKAMIAVLLSLLLVAGLIAGTWFGIGWLVDRVPSGSPDYPGPGTGEVVVVVQPGDSVSSIGAALVEQDVVKSVKAFTDAADDNPEALSLQPGSYQLRTQMKAADALALMLDPEARLLDKVTVPEGLQVDQTVTALVEGTEIPRDEFTAALKDPASLGLPDYADGDPEGFLFPATYEVEPATTATELLTTMTATFGRTADETDLEAGAKRLGYTPREIVTIASMAQAEVSNPDDFAKVTRAIYNRLDAGMKLQVDSTVKFVTGEEGVFTTDAERAVESPYNTYLNAGLPPGPINSPGQDALAAALNPADGTWLFWAAVNLETGETKFADTADEHARNVAELRRWIAANS